MLKAEWTPPVGYMIVAWVKQDIGRCLMRPYS